MTVVTVKSLTSISMGIWNKVEQHEDTYLEAFQHTANTLSPPQDPVAGGFGDDGVVGAPEKRE